MSEVTKQLGPMQTIETSQVDFGNTDICYHLTRDVYEEEISYDGIIPQIGRRSEGDLGGEKTPKVFFAKSLEGALIFLNRNGNIFRSVARDNNFAMLEKGIKDDKNYEDFKRVFEENVHENMSEEELNTLAMDLAYLYFKNSIYYKCNLEQSTVEEYKKMTPEEQKKIDYLIDDINEEKPDKKHTINNMHTISGKGIPTEKMELMTVKGEKSGMDVILEMCDAYKELHPGEHLPVLVFKRDEQGNVLKADRPILEMLAERLREKQREGKNEIEPGEFSKELATKSKNITMQSLTKNAIKQMKDKLEESTLVTEIEKEEQERKNPTNEKKGVNLE